MENVLSDSKADSTTTLRRGYNRRILHIACTGFVSEQAGSVAAANALLMQGLLAGGLKIDFFSKPTFVDPRPAVGEHPGFRFVSVVNSLSDGLRRKVQLVPVLATLVGRQDAASYNRLLVRRIRREHRANQYDAVLWLGDYAHGTVPGIPTISFAQGPPGTDARSVLRRRGEISLFAGGITAVKWSLLAWLRLSRWGCPSLHHSDRIVVGSTVSVKQLVAIYRVPSETIFLLPYPIDLELFQPGSHPTSRSGPLRVLWLGRIIPRKRLDLFLDGAALAIRKGFDLQLTVAGEIGFVKGYEKLIATFPFPDRLRWIQEVARIQVPELLNTHDVLAQPSEEENFGSSVAEAQACGLPVIVGVTNGNADYLSARDVHLADDLPETFATALQEMVARKLTGQFADAQVSRGFAEAMFHLPSVTARLLTIIQEACDRPPRSCVLA